MLSAVTAEDSLLNTQLFPMLPAPAGGGEHGLSDPKEPKEHKRRLSVS